MASRSQWHSLKAALRLRFFHKLVVDSPRMTATAFYCAFGQGGGEGVVG